MYHLKLVKAKSYSGHGIFATLMKPDVYVESEEIAKAAVATGYFILVQQEDKPEPLAPPEGDKPDFEHLATLNRADLVLYAKKHDIDIKGLKSKDDILERISVAYGGSYTMMELQEE